MKKTQMTITLMALITLIISNAQAGDKRVGGMLIGGGTGAIVGQVIGRNAESTIIGATVGGVAGLLIGNTLQRQPRPVYHPSHGGNYREQYGYRGYEKRQRPVFRDGYRSYRDNCRKIVTIKKSHHRTQRVVTTVCDNRSPRHHRDRFGYRF